MRRPGLPRGLQQPRDRKGGGGVIGVRAFGSSLFRGESFLIVDATPVDAKVFLDGALLGVAGQLVARAFPLAAGKHAIEIVAPGFRPYVAVFVTDLYGFSTRIRVSLVAERPMRLGSP